MAAWRRNLVAALVAALLLAGALGLVVRGAWAPLVEAGRLALRPHGRLLRETSQPRTGRPLVLLLGDSTFGGGLRTSHPKQLARSLGAAAEIRAIWEVGMGPAEHYLLLSRALALEPEAVVLLAHLRMLWGSEPLWYPSLLTLLPPSELPRALALPFHARGVGAGRLVLASLFGTLGRVSWMYAFAGGTELASGAPWLRWLVPVASSVGQQLDQRAARAVYRDRAGRYGEPLWPGHPALALLGASVEMAERRGARTLVLVSPVPVHRLLEAGLSEDAGIGARVQRVREVALARGGEVLDLHRALGEGDFRDALGHLTESGARRVADALEPWLRASLDLPPARRLRGARRP